MGIAENSRRRRGAKERVLPERLKREPPKKLSNTSPLDPGILLRAVIDIHDHHKNSDIRYNKHGNQPRSPVSLGSLRIVRRGVVARWVAVVAPVLHSTSPLQIFIRHFSPLFLSKKNWLRNRCIELKSTRDNVFK